MVTYHILRFLKSINVWGWMRRLLLSILIFDSFILRIVEDCPQLVILMLLTVVLYEPQGHFCITKIHDRWTKNLGNWSNQDVTFLRGQVDLNKSTTSLFFDKENMGIAISSFVAIFNVVLFTILGANKALKLRRKNLRRDYFLLAVRFLICNENKCVRFYQEPSFCAHF